MINNSISDKDEISSPNDIGGLQFHLDASVGVYGLAGQDISTNNGAQLKRWDDQAKNIFQTNGYPLCALSIRSSPATITSYQNNDPTGTGYIITSYPTISTNALNGKNAIYFDGYSGMQILNSLSTVNISDCLTRGRAFFVVYKQLPNSWSSNTLGLIYATGNFFVNVFPAAYPRTLNYYYIGNDIGPYNPYFIATSNGGWVWNAPTIITGNVWRILIVNHRRYGNATAYGEIFSNGVMCQAGYDGLRPPDGEISDNNISIAGIPYICIGSRAIAFGDGWGGLYGHIAECGMYFKNRGLTRMEVNQLTNYLKKKYAIA